MFVVVAVLIVVPKHAPIVTLVQLMIDVRQVVPGYTPVIIYSTHTSRRSWPFPRLSEILCDSSAIFLAAMVYYITPG